MTPRLRIQIDGEAHVAMRGEKLILALRRAGKRLPELCHHPRLEGSRACGLCTVRVDGELRSACGVTVSSGLEVELAPAEAAREEALRRITEAHPASCPTCPAAGDCALQDLVLDRGVEPLAAPAMGVDQKISPGRSLGAGLWLWEARCTGCGLCAAMAQEVLGEEGLVMAASSDGLPRPRAQSDLEGLRHYLENLVSICPTRALASRVSERSSPVSSPRRERADLRPWHRRALTTICPGCATGCAVDVAVPRQASGFGDLIPASPLAARDEEEVNAGWLCDRAAPVIAEEGRGTRSQPPAAVRGRAEGRRAALAHAAELLRRAHRRGEGRILIVVSYDTSNEEAWLLRRFLHEVIGEAQLLLLPVRSEAEADDFLRDADLHSNRRGTLLLLGEAVAADPRAAVDAAELLLTFGFEAPRADRPWAAVDPEFLRALDAVPARINLSAAGDDRERPSAVFLPLRAGRMSTGTRVNRQARIQAFRELPSSAARETEGLSTLHDLAEALGAGLGPARIASDVFAEILRFHPRFAGLDPARSASLMNALVAAESEGRSAESSRGGGA
jgi:NADH-quinone oxidoreductase subunit G